MNIVINIRRNLLALPAPPETSTSTTGSSRPSTGVSSSTSASPSITAHSTARRIANRLATPRRGLRTTQSSPLTLSSSSSPHNSFSRFVQLIDPDHQLIFLCQFLSFL